jgi:hypothetical protein
MPVLVSPVVVMAGRAAVPATNAALWLVSIVIAVVPADLRVRAVDAALVIVSMVGVVIVRLEAKYVELIEAAVAGMAFNTELTKKLSVTTESPDVHALTKTTVVPVVAVKSVDTRRTPFLYTSM